MPKTRFSILIAALAVAGSLLLLLLMHRDAAPLQDHSSAVATPHPPIASPSAGPAMRDETLQALEDSASKLNSATTAGDSKRILGALRDYLLSLPKPVATRLIMRFLDQKRDAPTRLQFALEENGFLSAAPTLRVFLLDLLAQIDPQTAGACAAQILATPSTPDEWAICLRNYARAGSPASTQALMEAKLQEMLANGAWRGDPSIGYLEAFDVAVYTHDTALTPTLAQLMADKSNTAVAHAAFLVLDRLSISDPVTVLTQLEANPAMMEGHEATRADYFARADVRDPQQKTILETYLLDPNRTQQEINAFAGIYPNENYMVSNNLLTQTQTPANADIIGRDQSAFATVQAWMADPRFRALQPQLQIIYNRLQTFTSQAPSAQ